MRLLVPLLFAFGLPLAHAGAVKDWGGVTVGVDAATAQMQKYAAGGQSVTAVYASQFIDRVRREALTAAERFTAATGPCTASSKVSFPGDAATGSPVEVSFEQHLFLVETVHCAPHPSTTEVARVYVSGDFRKATMPNLYAYTATTTRTCMNTAGTYGIIAPTAICMRIRTLDTPELYVEHGVIESNGTADDLQPVYFRESTVVALARTLADGSAGVAIYRRVLTRGPDIGSVGRSLLSRTTALTSSKVDGELARRLNAL
jgi:hypothetical protein